MVDTYVGVSTCFDVEVLCPRYRVGFDYGLSGSRSF